LGIKCTEFYSDSFTFNICIVQCLGVYFFTRHIVCPVFIIFAAVLNSIGRGRNTVYSWAYGTAPQVVDVYGWLLFFLLISVNYCYWFLVFCR